MPRPAPQLTEPQFPSLGEGGRARSYLPAVSVSRREVMLSDKYFVGHIGSQIGLVVFGAGGAQSQDLAWTRRGLYH